LLFPRLQGQASSAEYAHKMAETLAARHVKLFFGVPTIFYDLAATGVDLSGLLGLSRGSSLGSVKQRFASATHGLVIEGYGLTEAPSSITNPIEREKAGSVGLPNLGVSVEIRDGELLI